jgi:hypothetical protein
VRTTLITSSADDAPLLPLDILGEIAKSLIHDYAFGTCASLNMTCKAAEVETSPTLWRICVLPGAHAFLRLPPSARVPTTSTMSGQQVSALEQEELRRWHGIGNSKNAKWIQ